MPNEPFFSPLPAGAVYEPVVEEAPVAEVNASAEEVIPDPSKGEETIPDPSIKEEVIPDPSLPQTIEVIKEVEKIVEKYPEMDEHTNAIFTALMEGKDDVLLNYLSEKHRDYAAMSDYDAVKADMIKKNPKYTDEIAELKMERLYGDLKKINLSKLDEESEEYIEAVAHNKKVTENEKMLKIDAFDAKIALEAAKKDLKLPKIAETKEVTSQPTAEEIAQGRAVWEATVTKEVPKVKEFAWKVGDEEVSYKLNEAELKDNVEFMKNLNNNTLATELGWMDKDGKQNVSKIAGDVRFLKSIKQIVSSVYTQGKTAGAKSTAAEIKNLDLSNKSTATVAAQQADIGALAFGHLNN